MSEEKKQPGDKPTQEMIPLGFSERFALIGYLQGHEGNLVAGQIAKILTQRLMPTDEEKLAHGWKQDPETNRATWTLPDVVEIPFGPRGKELVVKRLRDLAEAEKLGVDSADLVSKFLPAADLAVNEEEV